MLDQNRNTNQITLPVSTSLDLAKMYLSPEGVMIVETPPNFKPTAQDVLDGSTLIMQLMDQPRPALFDIRGLVHLDFEARSAGHAKLKDVKFTAVALVIHSPISRLIAKLLLSFTRRPYPREVFYNRNQAMEWLINSYDPN